MATDNITLVRRLIDEVWNKGNFAALTELVPDQFVGHQPIVGDIRGAEALQRQVQMFRTACPDLRVTIDDIGASGDRVFVRWTGRGTHRGAFMGIPPTNNAGEVRGISIDRIASGKIVEHHETYDTLSLMQIIGAVPPIDQLMKGRGAQPQARPMA
jgi:steroid delta-isomerase-like uncharacterized protein